MARLSNKVALVTGAGSGIGQSIALKLASEGAKVVITGRSESGLKDTAEQHPNIYAITANVGETSDVTRVLNDIRERFDQLDIVVNNAGMAPVTPLAQQTLADFDAVFNINVRAVVDIGTQALTLLQASKGCIINISSAVASRPLPNMSVYCASKAALKTLTLSGPESLPEKGFGSIPSLWVRLIHLFTIKPTFQLKKYRDTKTALFSKSLLAALGSHEISPLLLPGLPRMMKQVSSPAQTSPLMADLVSNHF